MGLSILNHIDKRKLELSGAYIAARDLSDLTSAFIPSASSLFFIAAIPKGVEFEMVFPSPEGKIS